jgi:GTPase SAR1 family protein
VVDVKSKHYKGRVCLEAHDTCCTITGSSDTASVDTDGQLTVPAKRTPEECEALYSDAHGIFLMYDVTERKSYENMEEHLMELADYGSDDTMIFFIANKCDVPAEQRVVTTEEGDEFRREYGGFIYEVSALTGDKVAVAVEAMIYATVAILSSTEAGTDAVIETPVPSNAPAVEPSVTANAQTAAASPIPPKLTAWIDKQSKYLQFWNRRYFSLELGQILFQRTDKTSEHKNGLSLTNNCKLIPMGDFQLEIVSPAYKDMMLRFSKRLIRDAWQEAIQHHCDWGTSQGQEDSYVK